MKWKSRESTDFDVSGFDYVITTLCEGSYHEHDFVVDKEVLPAKGHETLLLLNNLMQKVNGYWGTLELDVNPDIAEHLDSLPEDIELLPLDEMRSNRVAFRFVHRDQGLKMYCSDRHELIRHNIHDIIREIEADSSFK